MGIADVQNLSELNELFIRNKQQLGEEEQRLFQAILLELAKAEGPDHQVLSALVTRLGELKNLK